MMMSLTYCKLELLICLHFPWQQPELTRRVCHSDVASGPLKCHFSALMWLHGTLKNSFNTQKKRELIKHIEWRVNVCGAAEMPEEQAGK